MFQNGSMNATQLPRLMTLFDVASWLSTTTRQVARMARDGSIPSRKLPSGDLAFDEAELAAWAQQLKSGREVPTNV